MTTLISQFLLQMLQSSCNVIKFKVHSQGPFSLLQFALFCIQPRAPKLILSATWLLFGRKESKVKPSLMKQ